MGELLSIDGIEKVILAAVRTPDLGGTVNEHLDELAFLAETAGH